MHCHVLAKSLVCQELGLGTHELGCVKYPPKLLETLHFIAQQGFRLVGHGFGASIHVSPEQAAMRAACRGMSEGAHRPNTTSSHCVVPQTSRILTDNLFSVQFMSLLTSCA